MSTILRSILLASFVGALLTGCGAAENAADSAAEMATDAASGAVEAAGDAVDATTEAAGDAVEATAEAVSGPGGYEPTEDERIPGITE